MVELNSMKREIDSWRIKVISGEDIFKSFQHARKHPFVFRGRCKFSGIWCPVAFKQNLTQPTIFMINTRLETLSKNAAAVSSNLFFIFFTIADMTADDLVRDTKNQYLHVDR